MKETVRNFLINLFRPTLYYVEDNQFLGPSIKKTKDYEINMLNTINVLDHKDQKRFSFNEVFVFKFNAKKELQKYLIPVNQRNVSLVKKLQENNLELSEYAVIQIMEDGEDSEIYQQLMAKAKARN